MSLDDAFGDTEPEAGATGSGPSAVMPETVEDVIHFIGRDAAPVVLDGHDELRIALSRRERHEPALWSERGMSLLEPSSALILIGCVRADTRAPADGDVMRIPRWRGDDQWLIAKTYDATALICSGESCEPPIGGMVAA